MTGSRKVVLLVASVLVAVGVAAVTGLVPGPESDRAAPAAVVSAKPAEPTAIDFEAIDLQGLPFYGGELEGRVVLLDFWAVWCAPCLDAFPKLTELANNLEGEPFELVGVTVFSGDHNEVRDFLEDHAVDYTIVVADNDLPYRYGVIGYPTYLLVDPDGAIAKKYVGALPGLEARIEADARALIQKHGLES